MTADPVLHPEISVVIPCRNEAANAAAIAAAISAELERAGVSFDIIFIDNASTDDTVEVIRGLCASDSRIRLIANTRNFGQMRSPVHGVYATRGQAVIGIAADFQDPPALLGQFIERWRKGADIVLGVRETEENGFLLSWTREFSYAFARKLGDYPVVRNATGFGLYDRKVIDAIHTMKDPEPFFRGMLVETGYTLETITYARPLRKGGRSNNNFFTLLDFALSSLTSTSKKLLRAPFFVGALALVIAGMSLVAALIALGLGRSVTGWLIAAGIELQFGLLFMFLGLIGDQLRIVSERTRQTPLVFERERVNFPEGY
jgi:glycosyltransferase involved in cell wall biosynthesis